MKRISQKNIPLEVHVEKSFGTELDLKQLAERLTWLPYKKEMPLGLGTLIKEEKGDLWLVGDADGDTDAGGQTLGCGCCSNELDIKEVAYLSELL